MSEKFSEEKIFEILKNALIELLEIESSKITLDSKIYEDLDIDSIDAIDIVDYIKKKTGYRMEATDFKEVRTIGDIVRVVTKQLNEKNL